MNNNKEQILAAIKAVPPHERGSAYTILKAIEPYLLQYDREEMWEAVNKSSGLDFILEGLVPANPAKRLTTKIDAIVVKL